MTTIVNGFQIRVDWHPSLRKGRMYVPASKQDIRDYALLVAANAFRKHYAHCSERPTWMYEDYAQDAILNSGLSDLLRTEKRPIAATVTIRQIG